MHLAPRVSLKMPSIFIIRPPDKYGYLQALTSLPLFHVCPSIEMVILVKQITLGRGPTFAVSDIDFRFH